MTAFNTVHSFGTKIPATHLAGGCYDGRKELTKFNSITLECTEKRSSSSTNSERANIFNDSHKRVQATILEFTKCKLSDASKCVLPLLLLEFVLFACMGTPVYVCMYESRAINGSLRGASVGKHFREKMRELVQSYIDDYMGGSSKKM